MQSTLSRLVSLALIVFFVASPLTAADKKISKELAKMYRADQDDQNRWEEIGDDVASRRQDERRDRVFEIARAGLLEKPVDYYYASMFFQHGRGPDDFLMAHILATVASLEEESQGFFMSAAALDRFAQAVDQLQRFGSQSSDAMGQDIGDTSKLMSEVFTQVYRQSKPYPRSGLVGKPIDEEVRSKKTLRIAQKELRKLAKKVSKVDDASEEAGDELRAMCLWTIETVDGGLLDKPDDFFNAALILLHGEGPDELLTAHICATTAGLLKHDKARALFARTLDAYMRSLGRVTVFGDLPAGEERAPVLMLHDNLRAHFLGKKKR